MRTDEIGYHRTDPLGESATGPIARLLVLNPNTNPEVTRRIRQVAEPFARPGLCLDVCNPVHGPFSIENDEHRARAGQEVLDMLRALTEPLPHAIVMACFDDLVLDEARALTGRPVVGTCEAGIAAARAISARFAIVTTVHSAVPGIRVLMQRHGAGDQAMVHAAGIGVAAAAQAGPEALEAVVRTARSAIRDHGADAILLASGGLTTLGPLLSERLGVPVVDGVQSAIAQAVKLLMPDAVALLRPD